MSIRNDPYVPRHASLAEVLAIGRDSASTERGNVAAGGPPTIRIAAVTLRGRFVRRE